MKGKPKFDYQDVVSFKYTKDGIVENKTGTVYIIDPYGTFENPNDVSYDILVERENMIYKHIPESDLI